MSLRQTPLLAKKTDLCYKIATIFSSAQLNASEKALKSSRFHSETAAFMVAKAGLKHAPYVMKTSTYLSFGAPIAPNCLYFGKRISCRPFYGQYREASFL